MELLGEADRPVAGPYRLVAELGRGGMGRVLLGVTPDGRLAAVKMVRSQFVEDGGFRARFRREVQASRRVSGAYTAAVVDADADAPLPWLASVFVPGPPLNEVVRTCGPLPARAAVRLAAGLAAALTEIHRAGLVHRDLKPSNVLLAADGPRVIDFGIARATDSEGGTEITHTGWLVGSPAFMSPEQAEGRELTPAADVFSLGVVLVQACTGRSPFAGTSAPQTLYNVVHTEPDLAGLPDELRDLVARCLAKDPSRRPTPAEILERIGQLGPATRPWPAAVHALIDAQQTEIARVLGLPEGGGGVREESGTVRLVRPGPDADTADLPTETAAPPAGPSAEPPPGPPAGPILPEGAPERRRPSRRAVLLGALGAGAVAVGVPLTLDQLSGSSAEGASGGPSSPSPSRSRSRTASPSASPSPRQPSRFMVSDRLDTMIQALAFTRDGRLIAVGDLDGGVELRDSSTLKTDAVLAGPGDTGVDNSTHDVVFSPDGKLLAAVDDYATITLWDVASRQKAGTINADKAQKDAGYSGSCLVFSPDGQTLAYAGNFTITLWDVKSRDRIATFVEHPDRQEFAVDGAVTGVAFAPDGRTLVATTSRSKLRFWDIRRRSLVATVEGPEQGLFDLTASPDGDVLAASAGAEVRLWRSGSREDIETLDFTQEVVGALAFSADGKSFAATERGGPVHIWSTATWNPVRVLDERVDGAAETMALAASDQAFCTALAFSPDGAFLAESLDYHLALWRLG
ncbi:Serine_threonine-protein kinase PknD [Streptomyces sp. enrichment culture]|uniref:WD40 repeat domain-containing serine/threonine protein kinase n=1 Tax=Streptomyces sp. enrichment culture TaxID=1795815 RepID=UPI003F55F119